MIAEGTAGEILVRAACRAGDLLVIGTGRRVAVTRLWHGGVSLKGKQLASRKP